MNRSSSRAAVTVLCAAIAGASLAGPADASPAAGQNTTVAGIESQVLAQGIVSAHSVVHLRDGRVEGTIFRIYDHDSGPVWHLKR